MCTLYSTRNLKLKGKVQRGKGQEWGQWKAVCVGQIWSFFNCCIVTREHLCTTDITLLSVGW